MIELYANNAYSTVASTLLSTATTVSVASGTGSRFPTPVPGVQFFRMTLTSASSPNTIYEIVYVTARTGDTLTLERGQEGTTSLTWNIGDLCGNVPTKGMLNQFVQPWVGSDSGTIDAYIVSTKQNQTAYFSGMLCTFTTLNTNVSSAPTLNVNGLGASVIKNANGSPLTLNQLPSNTPITVQYALYDDSWRLLSPLGAATAAYTADRAVITNGSGAIAVGAPTATQVNYLQNWIQNMTQSNLNPGYVKLPTGLCVQWGPLTCTSRTNYVAFPVAFDNAALIAYAVEGFGSAPSIDHQATWYGVDSTTLTANGVTICAQGWNKVTDTWVNPGGSYGNIVCNWLAIGY